MPPWRERDRLADLAAALRCDLGDRTVHDLVCGPGWSILQLDGTDRPGLVLAALPGAALVFPHEGPLPGPLRRSLARGGRVPPPLRGYRFAGAGVLPDDLVLALRLSGPGGEQHLLHQLFGSPGNTVLLDGGGRLLWAHRVQPHPCLLDPPPPAVYAATATPPVDGIAAAFTAAGLERLARQRTAALAEQMRRVLARRVATAQRLVENLSADLAGAERGEELRRDAETLAVHLHAITSGQAEATLLDPRDGQPRRLVLDPAANAATNLARLFKAARRAERGRDVIAARLDGARDVLAAARSLGAELEALPVTAPLDDLTAILALSERCLGAAAGGAARDDGRAVEAAPRPYRRYRLQGKWEVWVGRDSAENDRLTHHDSHPRDLWLHAQGVPGSHVILRTGGRPDAVPRAVLAAAAAIAALHSRARHSSLVPVIWTERRYVRKPRKAPPGLAVCLQERNLFVAPEIPAGVEQI